MSSFWNIKHLFCLYLNFTGKNPDFIQKQVQEAIAGVFLSKHLNLMKSLEKMKHKW